MEIEMLNSSLVYAVYKVAVFGFVLLIFGGITKKILNKDARFFVELLISTLSSVFVSVILTGPIESVVELLPTYILTPLFQQYASPVDANSVKISTPHYGMGMLLQDGYICKKYDFSSESEKETIELYYKKYDLNVTVTITPHIDFNSVEKYHEYYYKIYSENPNFYSAFGDRKPYSIFSFNQSNNKNNDVGIYYVLTYYENEIWYITEFFYPIGKKVCDEIVEKYYSFYISQ